MKNISRKNPVFFAYIVFATLLFAFKPTLSDQLDSESFRNVVFSFNVDPMLVFIGCSMVFVIVNLKSFNYDYILLLLITSSVLGLIPLIYSSQNNYLGNYFPLLFSVITYFILLQSDNNIEKSIRKIFIFCILIISGQVIYSEWKIFSSLSFGNFNLLSAKGNLAIPIGSSNLIACFLLPMIIFIFLSKRSLWSNLTCFIGLYALVLCRSKNALIILLLCIAVLPFIKFIKKVYLDRNLSKNKKLCIFITIFFCFLFCMNFVFEISNFIISDLSFNYFSSLSNPLLNHLDRISSGRVTVILDQFKSTEMHYVFGNGFSYELGQSKSHNWLIDLIVQRGFVGLMLYIFCLMLIISQSKPYLFDRVVRNLIIIWSIILIQGLFEISLFTAGIDFLFWTISAVIMSRIRGLKLKELKDN